MAASDTTNWQRLSTEIRKTQKTCEICGKEHKKMNIHHILPWARYKHLRLKRENLLVCCPGCHKLSRKSCENNCIWFAEWLMANKPEQYKWVKENIGVELEDGK